jgi:hypothetical protein
MHKKTTRKLNFGEKFIWESFGKMIANRKITSKLIWEI